MKLLMDSDCLIKLTKAGLKDLVAEESIVTIPGIVEQEVVEAGKNKGCADAQIVEENIQAQKIHVMGSTQEYPKGDDALLHLYRREEFDAVATDDAKLVRRFKMYGIPFILPALILYKLWKDQLIDELTVYTREVHQELCLPGSSALPSRAWIIRCMDNESTSHRGEWLCRPVPL